VAPAAGAALAALAGSPGAPETPGAMDAEKAATAAPRTHLHLHPGALIRTALLPALEELTR
jgi:hypothetical protein